MATLFNDSDKVFDDEVFTGFSREERLRLRRAHGIEDSDDEVLLGEEMSDGEHEGEAESHELEWNENSDDVDAPEFSQRVGPAREML